MDPQKTEPKETVWFKAKTYGYGWYPASWQGWGVMLLYFLAVILSAWEILGGAETGTTGVKHFLVRVLILSILLLYLSYKKGEHPRLQWGKSEKSHDNV